MPTKVIYIAPASGDTHHPQARIYSAMFDGSVNADGIKTHYRNHPERYTEVGLMNTQGRLVCLQGTQEQVQEVQDSQPLMAGLVFTFEVAK